MDYINRKINKTNNKTNNRFWIGSFIVISIVLIAFYIRIYTLKEEVTPHKNNKKALEVELPVLSNSKFTYPEKLKNPNESDFNSIYEVPGRSEYRLQCGTFRSLERAHILVKSISPVTPMNIVANGKLYVVISNVLPNKRAGEALKKEISKKTKTYGCTLNKHVVAST